ncbi:MAG: HAD family hydrolase [Candidatus Omnitrophica bacterium]|nr:HAD family hydrolase [Candidatus Omnitrophota bacterium]
MRPKNIKLIIFDLDGTLVDAYGAIVESFNHTMKSLGLPKQNPKTIRRAVGWGDALLLKPFLPADELDKGVAIYRAHHKRALLRHAHLFPYAEKLLRYLKKKGYKLAVASNRPTKFSRILVRSLKIDVFFDYLLCADTINNRKPHPEIINRIREKFKVGAKEAVFVGDMTIDAQAGRRAKVFSIIVTTGSSSLAEIKKEKPQLIIKKISRLFEVL